MKNANVEKFINNFWHLLECEKLVKTKTVIINKLESQPRLKKRNDKSLEMQRHLTLIFFKETNNYLAVFNCCN